MREIVRAENAGFCFGVKQAITLTEKTLHERNSKKIYSCGSLIHNKQVIEEFAALGLVQIDGPEEADPGAVVVVRSHGEPKAFYDVARERNLELADATCPFVKKIHNLVKGAKESGYQVVVVGEAKHPEVVGIAGWCDNTALAINSKEEVEALWHGLIQIYEQPDNIPPLFVVVQTTMEKVRFDEIVESLIVRDPRKDVLKKIFVNNTICSATTERQLSCIDTARKCDCMVVIGDKASANSRKLYEISTKYCENTYFVENKKDLPLKQIEKCNRIGVTAGASTPERVIMEVISSMNGTITENKEFNPMSDFMDEIDKTLRLPRPGEIITGEVIQVTDKEVIVNLGCKKDGVIPFDEITREGDQKLTELFKEGDEIQAKVLSHDNGDGNISLSRKKLEVNEHWDEITEAMDNRAVIHAKVVKQVKGGVIAAYKEVTGFIPLSQLSDRFVEDAEEYMGKVLPVKVSRIDKSRGKAVFSHKMVLAEERQKRVKEVWDALHVGDIVEGTVMRFTEYGAFVDVGGLDGLLHISEISWGKLKNPQEVLTVGQTINVKVLSMNEEKGKISLGLKQTQPEPWAVIDEKYQAGQVVTGAVVQIKEYGAFVELEPGLDGLVHISEVAHKRVTNIADEISVGQVVSAKILEIDKERKRISLSIKETLEPPIYEETANVEVAKEEVAAPVEEAPVTEEVVTEAEAPVAEVAETEEVAAEAAPEVAVAEAAPEVEAEATPEVGETAEAEETEEA